MIKDFEILMGVSIQIAVLESTKWDGTDALLVNNAEYVSSLPDHEFDIEQEPAR